MIALESLHVQLGAVHAVRGVSLQVSPGGWTMLIGANGAGKTSVLRAAAGLVDYGGSVTLDGRELRALGTRERARLVAVVPQSPLLPREMSVPEYVLLGRTPHLGYLGRAGSRDWRAAQDALARLGLGELTARRLGELSGGEARRAALARAIAQETPVLLLDEPTTALDLGRQQEVLDLVAELRAERGLTVLGATHDLTLAGQYADRLVLLAAGRVAGEGPPGAVLTEKLVARHYRARVRVTPVDDVLVVHPARSAGTRPPPPQESPSEHPPKPPRRRRRSPKRGLEF